MSLLRVRVEKVIARDGKVYGFARGPNGQEFFVSQLTGRFPLINNNRKVGFGETTDQTGNLHPLLAEEHEIMILPAKIKPSHQKKGKKPWARFWTTIELWDACVRSLNTSLSDEVRQ